MQKQAVSQHMILAKTVKGYGMGEAAEGKNIAHGVKKMDMTHVQYLRDRLGLQDLISDEEIKVSALPKTRRRLC